MTLVALSYIPAPHYCRRSHPLTNKWRRGLAILSRKSKDIDLSPTTLAAATEKYIHHPPSPHVVCCEDLTAKEFAQLAGIKINNEACCRSKSSSLFQSQDATLSTTTTHTTATTHHYSTTTNASVHFTTQSDRTASTTQSQSPSNRNTVSGDTFEPRIWDTDFWQKEEPVFLWCRHHRGPSVIQKGRFKIVVGQDNQEHDTTTQSIPTTSGVPDTSVVEWRRKRTLSRPTLCTT